MYNSEYASISKWGDFLKNDKCFLKAVILCAFSGILTSVSFSFEKLWFLCFFSLVPMFFAKIRYMCRLNHRKTFAAFFAYGFSLYSTLMLWLFELSSVLEEQMSKLASYALIFAGILFASLLLGLFYALPLTVSKSVANGNLLDCFVFSFLYILGEYLTQLFTPLSFPWARLCAIATPFKAFVQSASLLGGLFVSLIIVLFNCMLCLALCKCLASPKKGVCYALCALAVVGLNTLYGAIRLNNAENTSQKCNAVLVQGNFSGLSKWRASREEIISTYIDLAVQQIDENTEFVVFPETAAPFRLYQDEASLNMLLEFANQNDVVLITGVFYEENGNVYNSLVCIEPNGEISPPYHKQVLVPLGEYVPFSKQLMEHFPWLFEIIGYITPGEGSGEISTSNGVIGGVICYESIYPNIVRNTVSNGASVIALISNDSWFGQSPALRQHHAHAILRAIENNRYCLRASSTAITSVIDCYGNVIKSAPMLESAAIKADFEKINQNTLYTYLGDIILLPSFFIVVFEIFKIAKILASKRSLKQNI